MARDGAEAGFTLVELIAVMTIIAALLAIAVASYTGARAEATDAAAYCVSATVEGETWYKAGPTEPITQPACS